MPIILTAIRESMEEQGRLRHGAAGASAPALVEQGQSGGGGRNALPCLASHDSERPDRLQLAQPQH